MCFYQTAKECKVSRHEKREIFNQIPYFHLPLAGHEKLNKRCKSTTLLNWFHVRLSFLTVPATIMTLMISSHFHLTPHFNTHKNTRKLLTTKSSINVGVKISKHRDVFEPGSDTTSPSDVLMLTDPPTLVCHFAPTQ